MIYLLILVQIMFCSAIMDADSLDVFGQWGEKFYNKKPSKFRKILWQWLDSNSWENKYKIADRLIKIGVPKGLATYLTKDVFVIFFDLWHFSKAILMALVEYMVAELSIDFVNGLLPDSIQISVGLLTFILFLVGGSLFNFFYYNLRKIK